jgi:DNA-binding transcriptional LysR family regulator
VSGGRITRSWKVVIVMRALCNRRLLRNGTLPQLLALEAVVRLGSVTRAAEALHLAQPTVSGHLRKLGEAVGLPVCELGPHGMVATEAGRTLLLAAQDVFEALQQADERLSLLRGMAREAREARAPARRPLPAGLPA